ncbi:hypothetical protein RYA05_01005 [Pseudomonas syringae pv. actinidiae]|nr:hypothetical protein [Pseudomonas syringae pv. actinidiae]
MNSYPTETPHSEAKFWMASLLAVLVTIWMIMQLASFELPYGAVKPQSSDLKFSAVVSPNVALMGFVSPGRFKDTPEDRARVADFIERNITQQLCPEKDLLCPLSELAERSDSELRAFKYLAEQGPSRTMNEAIKLACAEDTCFYTNIFYHHKLLMQNVDAKQDWAAAKTAYIVGKKEVK